MSNAANGFGTVKKIDVSALSDSSFNEPITGKYLGIGQHKVKVTNLEVKDYGYGENILVTVEDANGASATVFVPIRFQPKDKTRPPMYSNEYKLFARLAVTDAEAGMRATYFTKMVTDNPALLDGLRGMQMTVTVSPARKGTNVVQNSEGTYNIVDVATGNIHAKAVGMSFMSLQEAADAVTALGLKRAFSEITAYNAAPEEVATNEKSLRAYLTELEKPSTVQNLHKFNAF